MKPLKTLGFVVMFACASPALADECRVMDVLTRLPEAACRSGEKVYHSNGTYAGQLGARWFHRNGQLAGSEGARWFYSDGSYAGQNGSPWFYPGGAYAGDFDFNELDALEFVLRGF